MQRRASGDEIMESVDPVDVKAGETRLGLEAGAVLWGRATVCTRTQRRALDQRGVRGPDVSGGVGGGKNRAKFSPALGACTTWLPTEAAAAG